MLADSLQIKRVAIAVLYPSMPPLDRKDALAFYDHVTSNRVDFPEFTQQPQQLVLMNKSGAGSGHVIEAQVGQIGQNAHRVLFAEAGGTRALKLSQESADIVMEAFRHVWGGRVPPHVLVEVSFNFTVAVGADGGGAVGLMLRQMDSVAQSAVNNLGREFQGFALRLLSDGMIQFGPGQRPDNVLANAQVDLSVEGSEHEPRNLVLNLIVKWPRAQFSASGLPPEARKAIGADMVNINADLRSASSYIGETYKYVTERILPFLEALQHP